MVGAVAADGDDVFEFFRLFHHLRQADIFVHQEPDAAGGAVPHRQAEDAFDVVGAAGKKTDDVGHHAGVVVDVDFEDGPGQGAIFMRGLSAGSQPSQRPSTGAHKAKSKPHSPQASRAEVQRSLTWAG